MPSMSVGSSYKNLLPDRHSDLVIDENPIKLMTLSKYIYDVKHSSEIECQTNITMESMNNVDTKMSEMMKVMSKLTTIQKS